MSHTVEQLSSSDLAEVVSVLSESFYDYPVMRHVLADAGESYDERLDALNEFFCERRLADGGWVLGVRVDGRLAGTAVLDGPEGGHSAEAEAQQREAVRSLVQVIGSAALERLKAYDEVTDAITPHGDYHYLGMLGVVRRCQGMGLGRLLVEATQTLARADELSTGVCLHTETETNVPIYERLGFEVVGEVDGAHLHTWCMMWTSPGG